MVFDQLLKKTINVADNHNNYKDISFINIWVPTTLKKLPLIKHNYIGTTSKKKNCPLRKHKYLDTIY